ncbi:MAG TPA: LapA family protein [Acidimicrobiia bacterium]|nr:LapA family protein [Acidimicrobiia bacterium]
MVHDDDRQERTTDRGRMARLILLAVLLTILLLFGIANSQSVKVDYLLDDRRVPLVWVILISAVVGAILDRLTSFARRRRD